jgi:hypothetical protein
MASTGLVLGQANPLALTLTTLYTVPALTYAVGSSIIICNRSTTPSEFRIAVRPAGAAISDEHYIYYDMEIYKTFIATIGITLATTDVVSVYAKDATLSFNLFGQEIT